MNTKCACGRSIGFESRFNRNKVHSEYCSRFCYESMKDQQKIDTTINLTKICYACDKTTILKYDYIHANKRFCSMECWHNLGKYKNGLRDFLILTAMYERPNLSVESIFKIAEKGTSTIKNARAVNHILGIWVKRGEIRREGKFPYAFTYVSKYRPGELIKKYHRLKL